MKIRYYQKGGRIGAAYRLSIKELDRVMDEDLIRFSPAKDPWYDEIDVGLVPEVVQADGKKGIREYVARTCCERHERHLAEHRKIRDDYYDRIENVNHAISATHKGQLLKGRVVAHEKGTLVRLEDPLAPEYGYVNTYRRYYTMFDHEGRLTETALEDSERFLIKLYEEAVSRRDFGDAVDLVEGLNGEKNEKR